MHRLPIRLAAFLALSLCGAGSAKSDGLLISTLQLRLAREAAGFQPQHVYHSPDRSKVAVITSKADVKRNDRVYDLDLFVLDACIPTCKRSRLASIPTFGNSPGISQLVWQGEGTLVYLGLDGNGLGQVFELNLSGGTMTQISHAVNGVQALAASRSAVAYIETSRDDPLMDGPSALSSGIEVSNQGLSGLIRNKSRSGAADATGGSEVLIVLREGKESRILLSASDDWLAETLKVSEGGDVSLLRRELRSTLGWDADGRATGKPISSAVLTVWGAAYGEPGLRRLIERPAGPGGAAVAWAPGGREVALTTLNLEGRAETVSTAYKAASAIQVIAPQCIPLAFQSRDDLVCRDAAEAVDVLWSRREGRWWSGAKAPVPTEPVWIDEAYDRAPVLKLREAGKAERVLWDLNPDFRPSIRVTEERFRLTGGAGEIKAGLYWPEGYSIDQRYPLVIQTHGWDRTTFQAEGLSSAGYAAMALAKSGFFVVQLPDLPMQSRADEGRAYAAYFDDVIDQLIEQGKVDGARLGLQGWSRTGFAVRTALQRGKHRYGAAILADSMSGGYMSWLASENLSPAYQATVAELNGGSSAAAPSQWVLRSPPINSMMTQTPVLLQAYGPQSLLGVWEDYVILKRANVPVELRYFPDAMHYPRKPGERVAVLESAVAWYSRWLLDLPRAPPVRDKAAGN